MTDYYSILEEAHAAAVDAQIGLADGGACGFAWVTIDGNSPLARYCRKVLKEIPEADQNWRVRRHYGAKGYPNGWQFWQPGNFRGQSIDAHEAGALAFRDALARHGIRADLGSRLD